MKEGRGGMKRGEHDQRIGDPFMGPLHRTGERPVTKQRQRVATRKFQHDS